MDAALYYLAKRPDVELERDRNVSSQYRMHWTRECKETKIKEKSEVVPLHRVSINSPD